MDWIKAWACYPDHLRELESKYFYRATMYVPAKASVEAVKGKRP
jgi:hypothetical protein